MKKYLFIVLLVGVVFGSEMNRLIKSEIETSALVMKYEAEEQLLVCADSEVDLGWGNCNSLLGNSNAPNGCMSSGCFSIEETTELNFSYINLGVLPANIGELTNLTYINISDCGLTGSLPESIGNLINLISIQIYDNNHSLTDSLDIINSELSGSIPIELGNLESLKYIRFDNNNLSGEIPIEIGQLDSLISLMLSGNQLSGEIPLALMASPSLASLLLSNNQFYGQIPLEIVDLANLQIIDISNNLLTGSIPPGMANLSELYYVNLSSNKLTGGIDEQFCTMYFTDFSENRFCGPYPQCFSMEELSGQDTSSCAGLSSFDQNYHPNKFIMHQNYPNPFNPITLLRYDLSQESLVNITIYDMTGKAVKTLVNGSQAAGFKSVQWNATNDRNEPVSAGLYLYTIQVGAFRNTKKMVLLK